MSRRSNTHSAMHSHTVHEAAHHCLATTLLDTEKCSSSVGRAVAARRYSTEQRLRAALWTPRCVGVAASSFTPQRDALGSITFSRTFSTFRVFPLNGRDMSAPWPHTATSWCCALLDTRRSKTMCRTGSEKLALCAFARPVLVRSRLVPVTADVRRTATKCIKTAHSPPGDDSISLSKPAVERRGSDSVVCAPV
jgi:hypothetical protein